MIRLIIVLIPLMVFNTLYGQVSNRDKIHYQAVVFDATGQIVVNETVGVKISLLADSETGDVVYAETHSTLTDKRGMLALDIGGGTTLQGQYDTIDWAGGKFFLKTEIDLQGGSNYSLTGIQNLMSVPFALHAKRMQEMDPIFSNSVATSITSSDTMAWNNKQNHLIAAGGINISNDTISYMNKKHYIGELYGGGVVFWVDETGEHGLIVGMVDIGGYVTWSNLFFSSASQDIDWTLDGATNTVAIINQPGHTASAAKFCADYTNDDYGTGIFDDWYLPSVSELSLLASKLFEVQKAMGSDGNDDTTINHYRGYWSSSEYSSSEALGILLATKKIMFNKKFGKNFIRPIRAF